MSIFNRKIRNLDGFFRRNARSLKSLKLFYFFYKILYQNIDYKFLRLHFFFIRWLLILKTFVNFVKQICSYKTFWFYVYFIIKVLFEINLSISIFISMYFDVCCKPFIWLWISVKKEKPRQACVFLILDAPDWVTESFSFFETLFKDLNILFQYFKKFFLKILYVFYRFFFLSYIIVRLFLLSVRFRNLKSGLYFRKRFILFINYFILKPLRTLNSNHRNSPLWVEWKWHVFMLRMEWVFRFLYTFFWFVFSVFFCILFFLKIFFLYLFKFHYKNITLRKSLKFRIYNESFELYNFDSTFIENFKEEEALYSYSYTTGDTDLSRFIVVDEDKIPDFFYRDEK